MAEQQAEVAAERKAQVGSGERSEKIRTYNFPQDRITDHRVKLTASGIERVLGGELDEFTEALAAEEKRRRLEAQATEAAGAGVEAATRRGIGRARRSRRAIDALAAAGVESPRLDAELLLAEATGWTAAALLADPERALTLGRRRARSARWSAAGCAASRSPTSSGARASATSSCGGRRGC